MPLKMLKTGDPHLVADDRASNPAKLSPKAAPAIPQLGVRAAKDGPTSAHPAIIPIIATPQTSPFSPFVVNHKPMAINSMGKKTKPRIGPTISGSCATNVVRKTGNR